MRIDESYKNCFGHLAKRRAEPKIIVIHHTCTSSPKKTREALIKQGYSTHFEVDTDGKVYQYADLNRVCLHAGSVNWQAIGIDVTHLKDAPFPAVQVKAVKELVEWLCKECNIPQVVNTQMSGIYPHGAIGCTECPNGFPMEYLSK